MRFNDPTRSILADLTALYLRPIAQWDDDGAGEMTAVFVPPLSGAEQTTFTDLQLMAKFGVQMTLAEWQSIKADAAALKAYNGVPTPTLVQTAAAVKAINRVLATIIRS